MKKLKRIISLMVCLVMLAAFSESACAMILTNVPGNSNGNEGVNEGNANQNPYGLEGVWTIDQTFTLSDPAPWNLEELKLCVDVKDPRSVAAYWVWAVNRLVDDYDDGMAMMKYLFADLEPYETGFYEGGKSGRAGWDTYFNERLKSPDYFWLPRTYFADSTQKDGFAIHRPLKVDLYYNEPNTNTLNSQSYEQLGRLNIVYWVISNAGQNQVNINLSKFSGSDRWYVTSGTSSTALFYDQRSALEDNELALAKSVKGDGSTKEEHERKYVTGSEGSDPVVPDPKEDEPGKIDYNDPANWGAFDKDAEDCKWSNTQIPFVDVPEQTYFRSSVAWAKENGVTQGTSDTKFSPNGTCTRGQVVTFLWRAAGEPEPTITENVFSDVKPEDYFYKPALWAYEKGITQYANPDKKLFAPTQNCSSMHIATFLYRSVNIGADGWGDEARTWAINNGLTEDIDLEVKIGEDCPRGVVVTFLYRYFKKN